MKKLYLSFLLSLVLLLIANIFALAQNNAPVANNDNYTTQENTTLYGTTVLANDTDVDGDTLTMSLIVNTAFGTLIVNTNGTFSYTPNLNFNGVDTFGYLVCDSVTPSLCDTGFVTIIVLPVAHTDTICIDLFNDVNGNGIRDLTETYLEGIVSINGLSGQSYTHYIPWHYNGHYLFPIVESRDAAGTDIFCSGFFLCPETPGPLKL